MRISYAIMLPGDARDEVRELTEPLRAEELEGLRWLKPAELHITIAFLGELPPTEMAALHRAGAAVARAASSFDLRTRGFVKLGSRRQGVFALKLAPCRGLAGLAEDLRRALTGEGYQSAVRGLDPHITLGRFLKADKARISELQRAGRRLEAPPLIRVADFDLLRSRVYPNDAAYSSLATFALGGEES